MAGIGCPTYPRQRRRAHTLRVPLQARVFACTLCLNFQGQAGTFVLLIKAPGPSIRPHADKLQTLLSIVVHKNLHLGLINTTIAPDTNLAACLLHPMEFCWWGLGWPMIRFSRHSPSSPCQTVPPGYFPSFGEFEKDVKRRNFEYSEYTDRSREEWCD